ncbi:MAG: SLC13 family permease [Eubacteriales bacterium]|nr:SLC13 family permease [Eubacteriales bacterium]
MTAQILAVSIFIAMFILIISEKIERHLVTMGSGAAVLILVFGLCMKDMEAIWRTLNFKSLATLNFWYQAGEASESSSGINWATILFIFGMMVMVEGMARVGFFRWLCMKIAKMVHFQVIPIFITFMLMSAVLAMFIDSITVILFLAAVTVELAQFLKFDPIPMILSEIFCANLGGSATMCGDPPNIIIGTSLGFSFFDFIMNTGVMAGISLVVILVYFYIVFRKELKVSGGRKMTETDMAKLHVEIKNKKEFLTSCGIFLLAVVLLITHAMTGLTVAFIGMLVAVLTVATAPKYAKEILGKVDYKTLLFFTGLFVVVGGLEETGILNVAAQIIGKLSGNNNMVMIAIIIWLSAIASAFVDNIPFAATMIPIIKSLSVSNHIALPVLAWALSMGTDIGGSATPIGASANVVGISVASREGYPIGWGRYCAKMVPATIIVCVISTVYMFVHYL